MYDIDIQGIDGEYSATVAKDGTKVDSLNGFNTHAKALKWAQEVARFHSLANRPSVVENYHTNYLP